MHQTANPTAPDALCLRPFRPGDQPAARALILAGLAERWGALDPTLNPDLDDIAASYAGGVFLVATLGDRLVGTGALRPWSSGTGLACEDAEIVRMSVATDVRRQGIGRHILDALCAAARARGCRRVVLETTSTWTDAITFYEGAGFRRTHTQGGDTYFALDL